MIYFLSKLDKFRLNGTRPEVINDIGRTQPQPKIMKTIMTTDGYFGMYMQHVSHNII